MIRRSLPVFLAVSALCAAGAALAGEAPAQPGPASAQPAPNASAEDKALSRVEKDNGLIIEDLVIGQGPEVQAGGAVVCHARGDFADGSNFFDTRQSGRLLAAPLTNMIQGWQEGIPGMKKGGKRRLIVPAKLAYGEQGKPPRIPPNAQLTFVVEVVDLLVIEDIKVGEGDPVPPGSTVTVHYRGTFEDGREFDSNVGSDAITFPLANVIQGWQFGIPGMKKGGVRKLVVPYQLAYGEQGKGPIPAKATLVFEVTLEDFEPPATAK